MSSAYNAIKSASRAKRLPPYPSPSLAALRVTLRLVERQNESQFAVLLHMDGIRVFRKPNDEQSRITSRHFLSRWRDTNPAVWLWCDGENIEIVTYNQIVTRMKE